VDRARERASIETDGLGGTCLAAARGRTSGAAPGQLQATAEGRNLVGIAGENAIPGK